MNWSYRDTLQSGPDRGQIEWVKPSYQAIYRILTHPAYAGAYTYGKRQSPAARSREITGASPTALEETWQVGSGVAGVQGLAITATTAHRPREAPQAGLPLEPEVGRADAGGLHDERQASVCRQLVVACGRA